MVSRLNANDANDPNGNGENGQDETNNDSDVLNNNANATNQIFVIPNSTSSGPQYLVLSSASQPLTTTQPLQHQQVYLTPPPPAYHFVDPPPEYNSWTHLNNSTPLVNSVQQTRRQDAALICSCCSQETHLPNAYTETSFEQSNLYPHTYPSYHRATHHIEQVYRNARQDDDSENAFDEGVLPSGHQEILSIKRWVLILLVVCLLLTVSLLIGVTLQHFQLLKKLSPDKISSYTNSSNGTSTFYQSPFHYFSV